ncbi:MAG: dethiobiotin synthase [Bacteroidota bacterium]
MTNTYFVSGIGTGIGKTIVSAILTEKLQADYWKPIQSGDLGNSDSFLVQRLISNTKTRILAEEFRLNNPLSPHLSARMDGISITVDQFRIPETENSLVIEGAGGVMVPLNDHELLLDLIVALKAKVIVVSQNYLGSINHSLLTLEILKAKNIPIEGIIFNGEANVESERYIQQYSKIKVIGRIPQFKTIDQETIRNAGSLLKI